MLACKNAGLQVIARAMTGSVTNLTRLPRRPVPVTPIPHQHSMTTKVADITNWMETVAPLRLSADWDNTGLLLGDAARTVRRLMTCLTLTPESVGEAVAGRADLVISHHPLPFRPLKKITTQEPTGRLLWQLASAGVSVYCPHTAWDSAARGINAMLAERLGLSDCRPLVPEASENGVLGAGRLGVLAQTMSVPELAKRISESVPHCRMRAVIASESVRKVAIVCGSGASLLDAAIKQGCDLFLTGEATFHQCLESQAAGVSMLMIGHFASEKFAMDQLAVLCGAEFADVEAWASLSEKDPVSSI